MSMGGELGVPVQFEVDDRAAPAEPKAAFGSTEQDRDGSSAVPVHVDDWRVWAASAIPWGSFEPNQPVINVSGAKHELQLGTTGSGTSVGLWWWGVPEGFGSSEARRVAASAWLDELAPEGW